MRGKRSIAMEEIFFARFKPEKGGHGGIRRITQLNNTVSNFLNYKIETTKHPIKEWKIDTRWGSLKYKWLRSCYPILEAWKDYGEHNFRYAAEWIERYKNRFDKWDFVLMEDPLYFAPLVDKIHKTPDLPLIVFIQNIESLGSENFDEKKRLAFFTFEVELLKKADLCVTISREETFLLKNLGVNVYYFPYYPSSDVETRMLQIREQRKNNEKKDILFVGTVGNTPTARGLMSIIDAWKEYKLHRTGHKLIIAGYGTNTYASYAQNAEGIELIGPIDDKILDTLLSEVAGTIIYQAAGSGALTKITELLIGNVPIIANSHAIRSHYNLSGIYEFVTFDEMAHIIKDGKFDLTDSIIPDKPDGSKLIDVIEKTIKEIKIKK